MYHSLKTATIIPTAGSGKRMGTAQPKQFIELGGRPVVYYALKTFYFCDWVDELIVVGRSEDRATIERIIEDIALEWVKRRGNHETSAAKNLVWQFVEGGSERQESVSNGLKALSKEVDLVMIHDGARPFVTQHLIEETLKEAQEYGAAVLGVPVKDTIKQVTSDFNVVKTLSRSELFAIQTPQTFKVPLITQAYQWAVENQFVATDDASLLEACHMPVRVVLGSYENFKITTSEDLLMAEHVIKERDRNAVENGTRL